MAAKSGSVPNQKCSNKNSSFTIDIMLTDNKIIQVIQEYEREYAILRKDSDAFHKNVAAKFVNIVDEEKKLVLDFFCVK
jgi:hypothetical protein